jgi:2-oxoisovalerate dehydrogenase E1 component beta subunit
MTTTEQPAAAAATPARARTLTVIEAVREALREEMQRDQRVVVLGEDIGPLGGVFRATDGLLAEFGPERVIDTPMMELGIAGLAVGMAMRGLRPVAEIQFADFLHAAADHLISDAARIRFRTNGDSACPLVLRTAYGGGLRGGPYHSQSVEAYYAHVPGLRVVAASFPADAKGLLTAAIRHPDPVLFLEHKRTYRAIRGEVPEGEYVLPLDRAHVIRRGRQLTLVSWGWVLHEALAAAEQLAAEGLEVEVIDPRSLNPLDRDTLLESIRRTGRLCVVHEDTRTMGLGAEIAALAAEDALEDLRAPVTRLTMPDVAGIPASGPMEDFVIPDRARIAAALRTLAAVDRPQRTMVPVNGRAWEAAAPASALAEPAPVAGPEAGSTWSELVVRASQQIPQASSVVEVDLSQAARRLERSRDQWRQRGLESGLSLTPLFAEALLGALREVPQANAAFDEQARGLRRYAAVHLGVSLASHDGQQPRHGVIRDADTRNALGLAVELESIRATGSTDPSVLCEATLCLADYGSESALYAVPLVLPGQVAAVRVGAVEERLVARERGFGLAPTAYVCASIDHRALDGMDAGALLGALKGLLEAQAP